MKKAAIVLHQNELATDGIEIHSISKLSAIAQMPHRDDHYIFILQEKGSFRWEIDFRETAFTGPAVCYIAPGQVHRYIDFKNSEGWLIFADTGLISNQCREIFRAYINTSQISAVTEVDALFKILPALINILAKRNLLLQRSLIISLMETFAGLLASHIAQSQTSVDLIGGQKYEYVIRFKHLIAEKHKDLKEVKAYAALLHLTPLYLNEIVREITGFPASYWINQEILLEARRMLYYTTLDVKQIAYELGYSDHAYFSRYFKKHSGITALAFRKENHYLSNHVH